MRWLDEPPGCARQWDGAASHRQAVRDRLFAFVCWNRAMGRAPCRVDGNWMRCVDEALRKSGGLAREAVTFLNMVLVKPSAHRELLERLGLTEEQSVYLSRYGHIGEQDSIINIIEGEQQGRLKDGDLRIILGAGIGTCGRDRRALGALRIDVGGSYMRLKDKVTQITGGAAGIGKATALRFAEEGAQVAICDVNEEAGQSVVRDLGPDASFRAVNVADRQAVQAWVDAVAERYGRIDALVNNAGILRDNQLVKFKDGEPVTVARSRLRPGDRSI
jgi:hypothetical protein